MLPEVIEAAIDALRNDPGLRELLVARYEKIRANPVKLDGGAGVRVALLQALRPIARSSDLAIFEGAVLVVEIGYGKDVAQNLRAAALFGIAELDPRLAAWYGARLLQDRRHVSVAAMNSRTWGRTCASSAWASARSISPSIAGSSVPLNVSAASSTRSGGGMEPSCRMHSDRTSGCAPPRRASR